MNARRQPALSNRQSDLHQPRRPSGGLEVADVGFHRPDRDCRSLSTGKHTRERFHFDPVAEDRGGPVCLDILHRLRLLRRVTQCLAHHCGLAARIGSDETAAAAVMVDSRSQNRRVDPVLVRQRRR